MINLGIDFGSTYTMVSAYRNDRPEVLQDISGSFTYPSIAAYDEKKNKYYFGISAKGKSGGSIKLFRSFKMLLNQQMSPQNLARRGYDQKNTPEHITRQFIRYVITESLKKTGEDKVKKLVVGAPECWFQNLSTVDARSTLAEICQGMTDIVETVEIVSEPTNAAVYSAWYYMRQTSRPLEGKILVIDYGGGTLDTALVEVSRVENGLQIKPELRSGAGENRDNKIGSAGIAYQEEVARRAISAAAEISPDSIPFDSQFENFLKALENYMISSGSEIEEFFSEIIGDIPEDQYDDELTTLDYKGISVPITFALLKEVYDEIIRPVLKKVLDDTTSGIDKVHKDFKLALVGGFSNYYLVRQQIYSYFAIGSLDECIKGMIQDESDREKAIAYGTSLISEGVITVCNVAQFSIGVYAENEDRNIIDHYAINLGQELEYDKIYIPKDSSGKDYAFGIFGAVDKFLINFGKSPETRIKVRPRSEFKAKLSAIKHGLYVIGFSIDSTEKITMHLFDYQNAERSNKPVLSIRLASLKDMFENTVLLSDGG